MRFFLRCEFFGGYLFDRLSLESWILNKETMLFSIIWLSAKNKDLAEIVTKVFFLHEEIDYEVFSMLPDCYSNSKVDPKMKNEKTLLGIDDWKRIITESADSGIETLSILGGEPTLYKDIAPLINQAETAGIKTTITTNGSYISSDLYEALKYSKFITTCVSLQSTNEKHFLLTGGQSFATIDTIKRLRKDDLFCGINTVLTTQNYNDILDIVNLCIDYDIPIFMLSLYVPKKKIFTSNYQIPDIRILHEKINDYIERKQSKLNFFVEGCLYYSAYHDLAKTEENIVDSTTDVFVAGNEYEKVAHGCDCGNGKLEIGCDGFTYPCCVYMGSDIKDRVSDYESITQLWNKSKHLSFFRNIKNLSIRDCYGCVFSGFCKGGCPYLIEESGKILGKEREDRCRVII